MIEEAYCNPEIAELLKKKGMDKECFTHYIQKNNSDGTSEALTTCTQQRAMRWLREIYEIYIIFFHTDKSGWWFNISDMKDSYVLYESKKAKRSFEEICEDAITYCLKNVI